MKTGSQFLLPRVSRLPRISQVDKPPSLEDQSSKPVMVKCQWSLPLRLTIQIGKPFYLFFLLTHLCHHQRHFHQTGWRASLDFFSVWGLLATATERLSPTAVIGQLVRIAGSCRSHPINFQRRKKHGKRSASKKGATFVTANDTHDGCLRSQKSRTTCA